MLPVAVLTVSYVLLNGGLHSTFSSQEVTEVDFRGNFSEFVLLFNKPYKEGTMEYEKRFFIFKNSLHRINWLNGHRSHPSSARYGITEFSDLTQDEFQNSVIKRIPSAQIYHDGDDEHDDHHHITKRSTPTSFEQKTSKLPRRIDWREKGVIGHVYNQGKCGACWAYSTIETIEAMDAIRRNVSLKEELSVQQVVDCATHDNHGCDGGDTCGALEWITASNVSLASAHDYPLRDDAGTCQNVKAASSNGIRVSKFTCSNFVGREEEIVRLLATHGPLVAAVDATSWQDYLGGIIQYNCEGNRNHAVQIVGYDLTGPIPYYIVRNSWGERFGLVGYIHIAIDRNLCAIPQEISAIYLQ